MNQKLKTFGILTLIFFSLIFFLSSVLLLLLFLFPFSQENSRTGHFRKTYKYSEFGPDTSKYGFVELSRDLSNEEYISYQNSETKNLVVISNFEGSTYECHGSCFCEPHEQRRSTTTSVLSRGLVFLITAFSTSLAIQIAQEKFQNDCQNQFFETCQPNDILSEVSKCSKTVDERVDTSKISKSVEDFVQDFKETEFPEMPVSLFVCEGHCISNPQYVRTVGPNECEKLKLRRELKIPPIPFLSGENEFSEKVFFLPILKDFCEKGGEILYQDKTGMKPPERKQNDPETICKAMKHELNDIISHKKQLDAATNFNCAKVEE